jgi:hypothetical protein
MPLPHPDFDPDERPPWEEDNPEVPRLALVPASSIRMEQTTWAWKDRIPLGGVTLLAGQEGSGKTTILADVLAQATRGKLDGDLRGEEVGCVYATAEDSWSRTLAPRLQAAGADLDRLFFVQIDGLSGGLSVPGDLLELSSRMRETGSRLLVLDPLGAHLGSSLDTHRDAAVRQALAPLASHMDALSAACVGIVHWSKAPTTQALDRVNGSRAFTAAARAMLAVAEDPEDEMLKVLILAKSNLGRLDVPALRYRVEGREITTPEGAQISTSGIAWLGEAPGVGASDIFASNDPDERTIRSETADALREILANGPLERKIVLARLKEAGYPTGDKTLQRLTKDLGIKRERDEFGGPFRLALPADLLSGQPGQCGPTSPTGVHYVQIESDLGFHSAPNVQNAHSGHSGHDVGKESGMAAPPPDDSLFLAGVDPHPAGPAPTTDSPAALFEDALMPDYESMSQDEGLELAANGAVLTQEGPWDETL